MNKENKKNIFQSIQIFFREYFRRILIIVGVLFLIFVSYQLYDYYKLQTIKKTSIIFFENIELDDKDLLFKNLESINNTDSFFSILSKLKLIQKSNILKEYDISNKLYKEILSSNKLNNLYKSAIASHASYALINASYENNSSKYFKDINFYIDNISDNLESYQSIKLELKYLILVTEIDIFKLNYNDNEKIIEIYDKIEKSNLVTSSVKERVKKIHEFQLYN